ncbi:MAG: spore coat-associated protein [Gaiellales bacterium]|jgi:predicted ribosomally synthesized peptide with SipW-like signal peptide|nr:spore coat-associated protein [Gaiellales bacterium]
MFMSRNRSTKLLLSLAALGVAGAMAGLGTFASFTSSTSAGHTVASGTVTLNLGATNRLTVGASGIAPGDTIQRAFDLTNAGTLDMATISLTSTATSSSLLDTDGTNGLQMVIDRCSNPWTESGPPYTYTCSGTTTTIVASRAVIGSNLTMAGLSALTAGGTDRLRLTLTFPAAAGNTFQNQSSTLQYTFTGTQRAATSK